MSKRVLMSLALCLMLVAGLAGTAFAHTIYARSPDGGAEAGSQHTSSVCGGTHPRVFLVDLKADGFSVRAEFFRGVNGPFILTEKRGKGYSTWSVCGAPVTRVRACTVRPLIPDSCSNWAT